MMKLRGMVNKLVEKFMDASNYASNEFQYAPENDPKANRILDNKMDSAKEYLKRTSEQIENEINKLAELKRKVDSFEYVEKRSVDMWGYYMAEFDIISKEYRERIEDEYRDKFWRKRADTWIERVEQRKEQEVE